MKNEKPNVFVMIIVLVIFSVCFVKCACSSNNSSTNNNGIYQGSQEQKNDLNDIDEYSKSHPGF